jgi:hypothetical protein
VESPTLIATLAVALAVQCTLIGVAAWVAMRVLGDARQQALELLAAIHESTPAALRAEWTEAQERLEGVLQAMEKKRRQIQGAADRLTQREQIAEQDAVPQSPEQMRAEIMRRYRGAGGLT